MKTNLVQTKITRISAFLLSILLLTNSAAFSEDEKIIPMDLDSTEWAAETVEVNDKGKKTTGTDVLKFMDGKFISQKFEDNGYQPTNYSLIVEEDGTTRFGTMQIKGKETSFWKGNVKDNTMDGSVHTQYANGTTRTVYYTGSLTTGVLKPKEEKKPEFPAPDPEPIAVPPVENIEAQLEVIVQEPDMVESGDSSDPVDLSEENVDLVPVPQE